MARPPQAQARLTSAADRNAATPGRFSADGSNGQLACVSAGSGMLHPADLRVLVRPFTLAQHELLGFARRCLRQRAELDRVRALVVREALPAERDDLLRGGLGALAERDERLRPLAPVRMRDPDDRAFEYGRVGGDRLLDFDAGDVLAAGDDDVLAAVAELDVAV